MTGGVISASNNGTKTVTLTGSQAQINATLAASGGLVYRAEAGYTGTDTLTVGANDLGASGDGGPKTAAPKTISINVSDVDESNQTPVLTVPLSLTAAKNGERVVTGISVADPDAGTGEISVTLEVSHGTLTVLSNVPNGVPSGKITGNQTAKVVLAGTVSQINATLAAANGLKYKPATDYTGTDSLKITADDNGHTGDGGAKQDVETVSILIGSGSLSGYVYIDANSDGARMVDDNGVPLEMGLAGVTMKLRQKSDTNDSYSDLATVTTGPDGFYLFDNIPAGTYEIVESQPEKFRDGPEKAGTLGGTVGDDRITGITLAAGDRGSGYDFSERGLKLDYISINLFLGSTPTAREIVCAYAGLREVMVPGTTGDDVIEFTAGAASHRVVVNGAERFYSASEVDVFIIDAGAGNDKVTLNGTDGADQAGAQPTYGSFRGANYMVEVLSAEKLTIDGKGGDDAATLYDSPGNDTLKTDGNKASLLGQNFLIDMIAFERVRAVSHRGGDDTAEQVADFVFLEGAWN